MTPRKSLQSSFYLGQPGSRQRRRRVSSGFCVIVSLLIKVKGVSWIFSPLHFFIRHLLLSSGGNVKRLEPVPTAYYLKSARCDPADVPGSNFSRFYTKNHSIVCFHGTAYASRVFVFGCDWDNSKLQSFEIPGTPLFFFCLVALIQTTHSHPGLVIKNGEHRLAVAPQDTWLTGRRVSLCLVIRGKRRWVIMKQSSISL